MNKMRIKYSFILFLLLIVSFNTSLSAEGKNLKLFLNISTGAFKALAFGAGAELRIYKSFSIKPSMDFTTIGGRIYYLDAVFTLKTSKRLKPFFTVGYLDYYFEGSSSHDRDAVKSVTFGFGIDSFSENGKSGFSLGVRFASSEETIFPIIYCNLILLRL